MYSAVVDDQPGFEAAKASEVVSRPGDLGVRADQERVGRWVLVSRAWMSMRVEDGLVTGIYAVRNPDKLSRIMREAAVSR